MDWEPYGVGFLFGVVIPLAAHVRRLLRADARGCRTRGRRCARPLVGGGAGRDRRSRSIQAGLAWYLSGPANFSAIYGSASAMFAFLLSIYLGASAFVVAAVLTSVVDEPARQAP